METKFFTPTHFIKETKLTKPMNLQDIIKDDTYRDYIKEYTENPDKFYKFQEKYIKEIGTEDYLKNIANFLDETLQNFGTIVNEESTINKKYYQIDNALEWIKQHLNRNLDENLEDTIHQKEIQLTKSIQELQEYLQFQENIHQTGQIKNEPQWYQEINKETKFIKDLLNLRYKIMNNEIQQEKVNKQILITDVENYLKTQH